MTFEEVFNSGYRFRLPENSQGENSWPSDFYWIRIDNNIIQFGSLNLRYKLTNMSLSEVEPPYFDRTDWYIHPVDELKWKFGNKLENIINDT